MGKTLTIEERVALSERNALELATLVHMLACVVQVRGRIWTPTIRTIRLGTTAVAKSLEQVIPDYQAWFDDGREY